jgi:hypothetical protein
VSDVSLFEVEEAHALIQMHIRTEERELSHARCRGRGKLSALTVVQRWSCTTEKSKRFVGFGPTNIIMVVMHYRNSESWEDAWPAQCQCQWG